MHDLMSGFYDTPNVNRFWNVGVGAMYRHPYLNAVCTLCIVNLVQVGGGVSYIAKRCPYESGI